MKRRPVNRILLLAQPGEGKTCLLKEMVRQYPTGGTILDKLGDFGDAGLRWDRLSVPYLPELNTDDPEEVDYIESIVDALNDLREGEALVGDEFGNFVPRSTSRRNPLLQFLDTCRNRRCKAAMAEKKASRLDSLLVDVATHVAFRPFRSVAARRWIEDAAEVSVDTLEELPMLAPSLDNPWYVLEIGKPLEIWTARQLLDGFLDQSDLSA